MIARVGSLAFTLAVASSALANPRPLPFTYTTATMPEGQVEVEQYADAVPLRGTATANGRPQWYLSSQFQTEIEIGLTSKLELGLYFVYAPSAASSALTNTTTPTERTGLKQRLRYRFANEGEWPVDVALYGELVENQDEIELEAKLILHRRFGPLRVATNVTGERELYFNGNREWVFQPTLGLSWEISPSIRPGLEGFVRVEFPDAKPPQRAFNLGPHTYVGPVMMVAIGSLWWTTGVYARLTDRRHTLEPGDAFGNVWVRTVVGVGL